jgi:hypothetical protein
VTAYDELVAPYAEQKAQGLKPRGRCSACGREVILYPDNSIAAHDVPDRGRKTFEHRNRKTTGEACVGGRTRTANLATVRTLPPLTEPEAKIVSGAIQRVLNDAGLRLSYDRTQTELLTSALAKISDPVYAKEM